MRRWLRLLAASLAMCVIGCGPARPPLPPPELPFTRTPDAAFRSRRPPPGRIEVRVPEIHRATLESGMQVVVVTRRDLPMATLSYVTRLGGEDTAGPEAGLAVLTGDMLLRGTRLPGGQVARDLHIHRRSPVVGTSMVHTHVSLEVLSASLPEAVKLLADLVQRPVFDPAEVERQKRAQLEELRDEAWAIQGSMRRLAARLRYGETHRLAALPSGDPARLDKLGAADVARFHRLAYRPEHSALVIVGDVAPEEATALAEQRFGGWRPPPPPAATSLSRGPRTERAAGIHAIDQDVAQTHLLVPGIGMPRTHPDYDVAMLISYLLGGLFESRGNMALRHATGSGYGAYFEVDARRETGDLYFWTIVDHNTAAQAITQMQSELLSLQRQPVRPEELAAAKARYLAELSEALATNTGTASLLVEAFAYGMDDGALTGYEARVRAIGPEDIVRVARRTFDVPHTPIVVTTDLSKTQRSLTRLSPVTRYQLSR